MAKTNEKNQILWSVVHFKGGDIRFTPNDLIIVDFIDQEAGSSLQITNPKIAFINDKIEVNPDVLKKIIINVTIMEQKRGPKLIVFKSRRRKNSCRKNGHRQDLTVIKVESIIQE